MKRRRLLAIFLVCSLLAGQTAWAADDAEGDAQTEPAVQAEEETEETAEEPAKEPADDPGEDTDTTKDETGASAQESAGTKGEESGSDELKSAQESQKSEGDGVDWDSLDGGIEMTVYMDIPRVSVGASWYEGDPEDYVAVVENPEVCDVELVTQDIHNMYTRFTGKSEGTTRVAVFEKTADGGLGEYNYDIFEITVSARPSDAADITDPAMSYALMEHCYADSNDDGYISQEELSSVDWFSAPNGDIPALRITDWSAMSQMNLYSVQLAYYEFDNLDFLTENIQNPAGLQVLRLTDCQVGDYSGLSVFTELGDLSVNGAGLSDLTMLAYVNKDTLHTLEASDNDITELTPLEGFDNLTIVRLLNNPNLKDVDVLKGLELLNVINLDETSVSDDDRWELANVPKTISVAKNAYAYVPPVAEIFEQGAYQVTVTSGADRISLDEVSVNRNYELKGLRTGTAVLEVTYKDHAQTVEVEVTPMDPVTESVSLRPGETAGYWMEADLEDCTVENENPDVCTVEFDTLYNTVDIIGIGAGVSKITVKDPDGDAVGVFHVTVTDWPERTTYVGQTRTLEGGSVYGGGTEGYEVTVEDETVCRAEKKVTEDMWGTLQVDIVVEGLKEGTTMVYLKNGGSIWVGYKVTVKTLPDDAVTFKDPGLTAAMLGIGSGADKNGDGYISTNEMLAVEYLNLIGYQINDLSGLEAAENLEMLALSDCNLTDLNLLTVVLPRVSYLDLSGNQITDLSGIENLPNLKSLDLGENQLSNLDVLKTADLSKIEDLYLRGNEIQSLSSLKASGAARAQETSLSSVKDLDLSDNPIEDMAGLESFYSLEILNMQDCGIENLEIMEGVDGEMENLISLALTNNPITDLSGISKFPNLETLNLYQADMNTLASLNSLKNPEKLRTLNVQYNQLVSLEGADILTGLETLWADHNEITDVRELAGMKELTTLYLSDNKITSVQGLGGQEKLAWIYLSGNSLTSLEGMGELPALETMDLSENQLKEVQELAQMGTLEWLDLSQNLLTSAEGLGGLKNLAYLNLSYNELTDIGELAGLTALEGLNLDGNEDLADISALKELKNLASLDISGTSVTDEDRWNVAELGDIALMNGETVSYPEEFYGLLPDLKLEAAEGSEGIVEIEEGYGNYRITGIGSGTATLTVSLGDQSKEITATVTGVEDLPAAGEDYEGAGMSTGARDTILDSNSDLWQFYPEVKKLGSNVKEYVSGWIYHSEGGDDYAYIVKNDDTVWTKDGQTKLAENVSRVENRYALEKDGTLVNLLNSGDEKIEGVKDWYISGRKVLILKEDGTIWTRTENPMGKDPGTLTQIASDAKELAADMGYLKEDGTLVNYFGKVLAQGAASLEGELGYYDAEGNFYLDVNGVYANMGQFTVKNHRDVYESGIKYTFYLTDDNRLYRAIGAAGVTLIAENVVCLSDFAYTNWIYQTEDGQCYDFSGNPTEAEGEVLDYAMDEYHRIFNVIRQEDGTVLTRGSVPILSNVVSVWCDVYTTYCLRTDGTVWNVTDIPVQVMDLQDTPAPEYVRGDADGDGKPDISDLRLVLRHVCRKVTLEGISFQAADVTDDGDVDIQDLRKILRFVCRKITEL